MYLFDRIEYQIGDKSIEYINYPGHSSLMKGLLSYPDNFENSGLNMCWQLDKGTGTPNLTTNAGFKQRHDKIITKGGGNFSFIIPLSHIKFIIQITNEYVFNNFKIVLNVNNLYIDYPVISIHIYNNTLQTTHQ